MATTKTAALDNALEAKGWNVDRGQHCCTTCASAAVGAKDKRPWIGYHQQDEEGAVEGYVYLFHDWGNNALHAGDLVETLFDLDIPFDWDGGSATRIKVLARTAVR